MCVLGLPPPLLPPSLLSLSVASDGREQKGVKLMVLLLLLLMMLLSRTKAKNKKKNLEK